MNDLYTCPRQAETLRRQREAYKNASKDFLTVADAFEGEETEEHMKLPVSRVDAIECFIYGVLSGIVVFILLLLILGN